LTLFILDILISTFSKYNFFYFITLCFLLSVTAIVTMKISCAFDIFCVIVIFFENFGST
jgi:hypothetical protein